MPPSSSSTLVRHCPPQLSAPLSSSSMSMCFMCLRSAAPHEYSQKLQIVVRNGWATEFRVTWHNAHRCSVKGVCRWSTTREGATCGAWAREGATGNGRKRTAGSTSASASRAPTACQYSCSGIASSIEGI